MRFSQRIGKTPVRTLLQRESIDEESMNLLWNLILEHLIYQLLDSGYTGIESPRDSFCLKIWTSFFKKRIDTVPADHYGCASADGVINHTQRWFFGAAKWYDLFDFLEFLINTDNKYVNINHFIIRCNHLLQQQVLAYRVIDKRLTEVTSEEEIVAIQYAIDETNKIKSVQAHLKTSLELLSNRQKPDYRNSIKESISAVEAYCKIITADDKATLGRALAIIEKQHNLHGSLKEAYSKIYGYTSDADGIRHSMLEDGVDISFEDAKFMLVSCSAFINYLKAKLKV